MKLCQDKDNKNLVEIAYWIDYSTKNFCRQTYVNVLDARKSFPSNISEGLFKSAYIYNSTDIENALAIGDLYLDFDSIDDFELARQDAIKVLAYLKIVFKIKYSELNIFFSGNKGIHITIPYKVLDVKPSKDINIVFKYIAKSAYNYTKNKTLDLQIYDKKRLFRIANTKHEKSHLFKIQLTYEELKELTYEEIISLAKSPRKIDYKKNLKNDFASKMYLEFESKALEEFNAKKNIESHGTLNYTPPCIQYLLENGAKDGNRNNSIAALASFYKSSGKDSKTSIALIEEWNSKLNVPPTSSNEVQRTILSIYSINKSFGCSRLKDISICDKEKCILVK